MTTADWALVVSLCSFLVALSGFVWNIWSKFIYPQPKVRVTIAVYKAVDQHFTSPGFISAKATNYGPGEVTLTHAVGRARNGPFGPQKQFPWKLATGPAPWDPNTAQFDVFGFGVLPHKMQVGEQFSVNANIANNAFDAGTTKLGFSDTFGRTHWVPMRQLRDFLVKVVEERSAQGLATITGGD